MYCGFMQKIRSATESLIVIDIQGLQDKTFAYYGHFERMPR